MTVDSKEKIAYLQMLQGVIARMSDNSRAMKGWCLTVASAICGFAISSEEQALHLVAMVSTLFFWALDAAYLSQERCFVSLYNKFIKDGDDAATMLFSMDTKQLHCGRNTWLGAFLGSWSTIGFYLPIIIIFLAIYCALGFDGLLGWCPCCHGR